MSEIHQIQKNIEIEASKEQVWEILFDDANYKLWASVFSQGAFAITDWQAGSKVIFGDDTNSGLIGKIVKALPYEMLKIKYDGVLDGGQEYYGEGDVADFMNAVETYSLTEKDGVTILYIDSPMNEEYFDFMSLAWDKALLKIKELAEKKALDL